MSNTFERKEIKYVLSKKQYEEILNEVEKHCTKDNLSLSTIQSIYYDTPNYEIIRKSIEKPDYKEKLRSRSYGLANDKSEIFFELKKKYDGIVYKRRIKTNQTKIDQILKYPYSFENADQITREIANFATNYENLAPKYLIIYDRIALKGENDLRITFDQNPRYRTTDLNLTTSLDGAPLLGEGEVIMEVKTSTAMPLWLAHLLSEKKAYKQSFSKVGQAYKLDMLSKLSLKQSRMFACA